MGDLTGSLGAAPRLIGAAWALVRADALAPREIAPLLPVSARLASAFLRLFAGRQATQGRPGERLALVLERQGPVAIKLGQFLSTRADVFGAAFAADLARLKDRLAPFPTAVAAVEVERALGRPLAGLYARFDDAVGAASLAQVHAATLLDGRRVAVKVLRPGVEARVAADIAALSLAARLTDLVAPAARRLAPRAFAATIARALTLELDLRFEAAGADELREAMGLDIHMTAPKVVWDGVARRVLTSSGSRETPCPRRPSSSDWAPTGPAWRPTWSAAFLPRRWITGCFTPIFTRAICSSTRSGGWWPWISASSDGWVRTSAGIWRKSSGAF